MSTLDAIKKQLGAALKGIDKEFARREKEPEREWTEQQRDEFNAMCDEFDKEEAEAEEDRNPYEGASWGEASNWFCIRCGSCLREVPRDDKAHGKAAWSSMKKDGTQWYQCSQRECFHYSAPLILHHPIGGYTSPAGESYSISWVR